MSNKIAAGIAVCDDNIYLPAVLESIRTMAMRVAFISEVDWNGNEGDWKTTEQIVEECGGEVVRGRWTSEEEHRAAMHAWFLAKGITQMMLVDSDEIYQAKLVDNIMAFAQNDLADILRINWETAWHQPDFWIRPREQFKPIVLVNLANSRYLGGREFEGPRANLLSDAYGICWHQSYSAGRARVAKKVSSWGHKTQVVEGWFDEVFCKWEGNKLMQNLHPTHPGAYGYAEHVHLPDELKILLAKGAEIWKRIAGSVPEGYGFSPEMAPNFDYGHGVVQLPEGEKGLPSSTKGKRAKIKSGKLKVVIGTEARLAPALPLPHSPTLVSFVIALCGGPDEIRACLESIKRLRDPHQVIIVDNASPDDALKVAESYSPDKIVRWKENKGYAAANNEGAKHAKHDIVVFLNSDAAVPEAGLRELIKSLTASNAIAAAGPYTNHAGHGQQVFSTYSGLDTLELFAEDFAGRSAVDEDTDMLVGFCLAVRKAAFEEVGGFDTQFGLGTYEDNDLIYRLCRASFRAVRSAKAFVHHEGSKTLKRLGIDTRKLLLENRAKFVKKHARDLEFDYPSHLSGLGEGPIQFNPLRKPETVLARVHEFASHLGVDLCMIVKNEAANLEECLESVRHLFANVNVLDTGSTDDTKGIARRFACKVGDHKWNDSFADARSESFRMSNAKFKVWTDGDDVWPFATGEEMLNAIANLPADHCGIVMETEFNGGVVVDHLKVVRDHPGLYWKGRIHEQHLHSARQEGCGMLLRIKGRIWHKNYDDSVAGQKRKYERDMHLLGRALEDDPNDSYMQFCMGMTLNNHGDHEQAIYWVRTSLDGGALDSSFGKKCYALWTQSLSALGRKEEALVLAEKGLSQVPGDPELHFEAGKLFHGRGCLVEARQHFLKATEADTTGNFGSLDRGILSFKSFHNIGLVEHDMGNYPAAKEMFVRALNEAPMWTLSAMALFDSAMHFHDLGTAREMYGHVRKFEGFSRNWLAMTRAYAEFLQDPRAELEMLSSAVREDPYAVIPRAALADKLLTSGDERSAVDHYVIAQELGDPGSAFGLGEIARNRGFREQAVKWFERALVLNPGHEQTIQMLEGLGAKP